MSSSSMISCHHCDKIVCLHQAEGADAFNWVFTLVVAHMALQDKKTTWHFDLSCAAHIIRNIEKYLMIMNNVNWEVIFNKVSRQFR